MPPVSKAGGGKSKGGPSAAPPSAQPGGTQRTIQTRSQKAGLQVCFISVLLIRLIVDLSASFQLVVSTVISNRELNITSALELKPLSIHLLSWNT